MMHARQSQSALKYRAHLDPGSRSVNVGELEAALSVQKSGAQTVLGSLVPLVLTSATLG